MYKALLHEYYTKRDTNGNVYHSVKVTNPKNGKSFITETPSMGNVISIISRILLTKNRTGAFPYYTTESCTGSARLSSLPTGHYLNQCHPDDMWLRALRDIGYRVPKTNNELSKTRNAYNKSKKYSG